MHFLMSKDLKTPQKNKENISNSTSRIPLPAPLGSPSKLKLPNPLQVAPQHLLVPSPNIPVNPFTGSPIFRELPQTYSPSSFGDSNSLPNITDTHSPSFQVRKIN